MKLKIISGIFLLLMALIYGCESDGSIEFKQYYSSGALVYQQHCQSCHGDKGEGLAALIPPLTDTLSLRKIKTQLPCIVKYGLTGQLTVSGRKFNQQMPAVSLTPIEMAQVITYVTNSFGNNSGVMSSDEITPLLAKCN